ncbi:MAG TPA: VOC family protein [Ktedonobacteraceae bacterium]|nr:VOC family protein [Ktedonobacteraceae bacterium]
MVRTAFSHMAISCKNPLTVESFYVKHFGFKRARVVAPGPNQVVFLKREDIYLEIFQAKQDTPLPSAGGAGPEYPGWRHLAFTVDSVDAKLAEMGQEAHITLGPLNFDEVIKGWRTAWIADPEGNIVEITQGYTDQDNLLQQ